MEGKRKRVRRKDARPAEILQAAMDEFSERGFAGAKIQGIATRAGVAKGTVYLYFKTKEELFEGVVRDQIRPIYTKNEQIAEMWDGSQADLLRTLLERIYAELVNNDRRRMILQVLIAEGGRFEELSKFYHREIVAGARSVVDQIIRKGIESGEFRDTPISEEPAVVFGPVALAAVWKMTFDSAEKLNMKRWLTAHLDLVIHGLKNHDA